jgi:hypothetical protein
LASAVDMMIYNFNGHIYKEINYGCIWKS